MESYLKKIKIIDDLKKDVERLKARGKRIVFTNGCFDILHPGHTRYLNEAKESGDYLVVGLNSDQSVEAIKGKGRPINPQGFRAEVLAALKCVDAVIIFDEEDPFNVIQTILPDILVKGADWPEDQIIGGDVVKAAGGEVKRIPLVSGYSTTKIIQKIKQDL